MTTTMATMLPIMAPVLHSPVRGRPVVMITPCGWHVTNQRPVTAPVPPARPAMPEWARRGLRLRQAADRSRDSVIARIAAPPARAGPIRALKWVVGAVAAVAGQRHHALLEGIEIAVVEPG